MSAGPFEEGRYLSDNGFIYPVRVQPETSQLTLNNVGNDYPAAAATPNIGTLVLTKGKRSFGVIPRTVTVQMTEAPTGQVADYAGIGSTFVIPVFDDTVWDSYAKGQTGSYLATQVKFVFKNPEIIR